MNLLILRYNVELNKSVVEMHHIRTSHVARRISQETDDCPCGICMWRLLRLCFALFRQVPQPPTVIGVEIEALTAPDAA